jgi:FkbM family methyltransferase
MLADITERPGFRTVVRGAVSFRVLDAPLVTRAQAEFESGFEEGTLQFFDAALPLCDRMIDFGAYIGFTTLYAACVVASVVAFEPSGTNFSLLRRNVALNPDLAPRIALHNHALGDHDDEVMLYGKGLADSGSSLYETIDRQVRLRGRPEGAVELRDAGTVLRETGLGPRTLLKIDIEGSEYQVIPAIADLLAREKPFVHISFHPFNVVTGGDEYVDSLTRLRMSLQVAEAVAPYRYMYFHGEEGWVCIAPPARMMMLRQYLLRPKAIERLASPQYGFIGAVAFSDVALPALCP